MKWVVFFFVPIFFHEAKLIKLPHVYSLNFFFSSSPKKKSLKIRQKKKTNQRKMIYLLTEFVAIGT